MSSVKWDIKEIMSEHNTYVDILLRVRNALKYDSCAVVTLKCRNIILCIKRLYEPHEFLARQVICKVEIGRNHHIRIHVANPVARILYLEHLAGSPAKVCKTLFMILQDPILLGPIRSYSTPVW